MQLKGRHTSSIKDDEKGLKSSKPVRQNFINQAMKLIIIVTVALIAVATALGQLSNVQNQRLQYDLGTRLEHRRMILATIDKINRIPSFAQRQRAMHGLRVIVRQLLRDYKAEEDTVAKRQNYRRKMFNRNYY